MRDKLIYSGRGYSEYRRPDGTVYQMQDHAPDAGRAERGAKQRICEVIKRATPPRFRYRPNHTPSN